MDQTVKSLAGSRPKAYAAEMQGEDIPAKIFNVLNNNLYLLIFTNKQLTKDS